MSNRPLADAVLASICAIGASAAQCAPTWLPSAPTPTPPTVWALATMPDGDVIAAGAFTSLGGVVASNVARWDGSTWAPLGAGVNGWVNALAIAPNGDLIAGGSFTTAGGAPAFCVARWNGAAWSTLGSGPASVVTGLTTRSNGDVIALVGSGLQRWDGASWTWLPGLQGLHLRSLVTLPNDDVIVLGDGYLPAAGPAAIALWNGVGFSALGGNTFGEAFHALVRRNGDLVASGVNLDAPTGSTPIVRLAGTGWVALDPALGGIVYALTELPDGDLIAGGSMTIQGQPWGTIGRWNGTSWSTIDGGTNGHVNDLVLGGRGELFAAGAFTMAGSSVSPRLARTSVPCPASASTFGAGCASTAGPVALSTNDLPWAGSTFHSTATGMTPLSLAVHVIGLNGVALPLPLGAPGCSLLVDPIVTDILFPVAGLVGAALAIPDAPSLAGAVVYTQVVGLELDASLGLVRTSSTNALVLTIGAL